MAATNRDLEAEARAGRFREDLFYRLNVIEITLPPLRQRRRDVLPLARHLLGFFARQSGKAVAGFTPEAEAAMGAYAWPGNVRELRNAVERGVILTRDPLVGLEHLPGQLTGATATRIELGGPVTLEELEAEHVRRVVASSPTLDEAATTLGIDPSTLYRKRKRIGHP
jgi:NtrC-family two-component system response regulator AlgB